MSHSAPKAVLAAVTASLAWVASPSNAAACGCFSPPIPMPGAVDFAVNQQAEQIIFEVEPDGEHIVAHVLIRYAGDPTQFAWLVPVPSVPELELSFAEAFGLIDAQTAPTVNVVTENICPGPLYYCRQHPMPSCPGVNGGFGGAAGAAGTFASSAGMGGTGGAGGGSGSLDAPPVTVYSREQIGAYDTIVFGAGDAQAAVDWLQTEGFIVNDTTSPYMEPYLAENMLFVAAKLVPGSDVDEIRPLRMRYEGDEPMIPLQLTAVATEPNLTVTAYIYGATGFVPQDQTLLTGDDIPSDALGATPNNLNLRHNYPMVLSRLIDEEGGRAFMLEYSSAPPRFQPTPIPVGFGGAASDCCAAAEMGIDTCGIVADGECQCPLGLADEPDCSDKPELIGGVRLVEDLAAKYPRITRITTRMSAEEMTFDPMFEADAALESNPRLALTANLSSLSGCEAYVLEEERFETLQAVQACATVYCGRGRCAATELGAGCACDAGHVARTYTDLDGEPSVTCVPDEAPVDLAAGGVLIPDICGTLSGEESSSCVNLAGFAGMRCDEDEAAVLSGSGIAPRCGAITHDSGQSGARDFSQPYELVRICAAQPPTCDARFGWLEETNETQRASVERCPSSLADPSWLVVPPKPTCEMIEDILDDEPAGAGGTNGAAGAGGVFVPANTNEMRPMLSSTGSGSDGCNVSGGSLSGVLAPGLLALLWLGRRRRNARAAREIS
jgi:hypothetical protein